MGTQKLLDVAREIDGDLGAIRQILRRPSAALAEKSGLTAPQQNAMRLLINSGSLSLKDLSKELGLAHSTVSGIIERLEKRGMVKRRINPKDRRINEVVVTDKVRNFWRNEWPLITAHPIAEALRAASPAQRQQMARAIRSLRKLLERSRPPLEDR